MHNVVVVGVGSIGERHLRCFLATKRANVSFVEVNRELRDTIASRYPEATPLGSIEEAIERRVGAAVIATPAPLHIPQATQFVERGIHVLIEKPLSVSFNGVDALQQRVRERGVVAAVAYVMRAHPALAGTREAIASGRFGRPLQLTFVSGQNFPTFRPAYRNIYYARRESGGGAVQDALTHGLNAAQWIVGSIERVVADVAHLALQGVEVEDTAHVLTRHAGGVLGSFSLNQHQAPNELTMTVVCERGTARWELHANRWRWMEKPGDAWADVGGEPLERDEWFIRQVHAFLDAVEGKAAPLCSLEEGAATLRANTAILRSADEGAWCSTGAGATSK